MKLNGLTGGIVPPPPLKEKDTLITWSDLYSGTILWSQSTAFRKCASLKRTRISLINVNNDLRRIGVLGEEGDGFMGGSAWLLPAFFGF